MELTLVGTGHVFDIEEPVRLLIESRRPDVVCVELDALRLRGLEERRRLRQLREEDPEAAERLDAEHKEARKKLPLAYRALAQLQERLATGEGVEPGAEMLAAVDVARRHQVPIACIDVEAQALLRRAWRSMGLIERFRFTMALLVHGRPRRTGARGRTVDEEMELYQADPLAYLSRFGDQFPNLKRVLIDDRDRHMSAVLLQLARRGPPGSRASATTSRTAHHPQPSPTSSTPPDTVATDAGADQQGRTDDLAGPSPLRVIAFVGDGHVAGMERMLRDAQAEGSEGLLETLEVVRVQALREGTLPPPPFDERAPYPTMRTHEEGAASPGGDTSTASVGFSVETDTGAWT